MNVRTKFEVRIALPVPVKTASEMTYTVSGGALNSTQSNPVIEGSDVFEFGERA